MLLTPHAVTGAAIAALTPEPAVSVPVALTSHFLLDTVPHWQETLPPYSPHLGTWVRIPLDLGLALALVRLIARSHPRDALVIWITAVAAMLPDTDSALSVLPALAARRLPARYGRWHAGLQQETASPWGIVPQAALVLGCLALAARRKASR